MILVRGLQIRPPVGRLTHSEFGLSRPHLIHLSSTHHSQPCYNNNKWHAATTLKPPSPVAIGSINISECLFCDLAAFQITFLQPRPAASLLDAKVFVVLGPPNTKHIKIHSHLLHRSLRRLPRPRNFSLFALAPNLTQPLTAHSQPRRLGNHHGRRIRGAACLPRLCVAPHEIKAPRLPPPS